MAKRKRETRHAMVMRRFNAGESIEGLAIALRAKNGKKLFWCSVEVDVMVLAHDDHEALRLAQRGAREELENLDASDFSVQVAHVYPVQWADAIPYGEESDRTVKTLHEMIKKGEPL